MINRKSRKVWASRKFSIEPLLSNRQVQKMITAYLETEDEISSENICILQRGVQYIEKANMLQVCLKVEGEKVNYLTFYVMDFLPS